jgi:hypothetical protein
MSAKKKEEKLIPITGVYIKHIPREDLFEKTIKELDELPENIDATLKNIKRHPDRPFRCEYALDKKISLWIPEKIYQFIKNKSAKENEPMRKIILDAIMEQYDEEMFGEDD